MRDPAKGRQYISCPRCKAQRSIRVVRYDSTCMICGYVLYFGKRDIQFCREGGDPEAATPMGRPRTAREPGTVRRRKTEIQPEIRQELELERQYGTG